MQINILLKCVCRSPCILVFTWDNNKDTHPAPTKNNMCLHILTIQLLLKWDYTIQLIWISSCFFKVMVELKFVCYFFGCSLDLSFCVIVYSSQVIFFPYTLNTHTKYIKVKLWQLQILHIKVVTSSGYFKLFKNLYQPYLTLINQIWLRCVICIIIFHLYNRSL